MRATRVSIIGSLLLFSSTLFAGEDVSELKEQVKQLMKRIDVLEKEGRQKNDVLTEEIINLKAAKTSSTDSKFSFGGYGHMDYTGYQNKQASDQLDIYRAVFYAGYKFSDDIRFGSEIEFEHGGGEVSVEQAYLDFALNQNNTLRVGHMIMPVGYINIYHEPTVFSAVTRPETERYIIPSTWGENGVMLHGRYGSVGYSIGAFAGLDASKGTEIRGMRSGGDQSKAEDFGYAARVEYAALNDALTLGISGFYGQADQGVSALKGVNTGVWEAHAIYKKSGLELLGMYARSNIENADKVAIVAAKDSSGQASGWYVNAAYTIDKFTPFVRYENINRFEKKYTATTGVKKESDKDNKITTIGVNYKPVPNVVLKTDYSFYSNKGTKDDRIEAQVGYVF